MIFSLFDVGLFLIAALGARVPCSELSAECGQVPAAQHRAQPRQPRPGCKGRTWHLPCFVPTLSSPNVIGDAANPSPVSCDPCGEMWQLVVLMLV